MKTLQLNTDWVCEYFEMEPGLYEFMNDVPVALLAEWSFDKRRTANWLAWLRRAFTLHPTGECVHYYLLIDSAPDTAAIYINGQAVGLFTPPGPDDPPFELDVTDFVALGQNELAFRLGAGAAGGFDNVRLQAVPCE